MTTIYVDSRKRVAGSDSDFEVDRAMPGWPSTRSGWPTAFCRLTVAGTSASSFSVDHMLGPSFVSGGQQVFEFVRMMAHNKLRCAQLANASQALGILGPAAPAPMRSAAA